MHQNIYHVQLVYAILADAALYAIIYHADAADYAIVAHANAIFIFHL
jgi:hypothetical protein